MKLLNQKKNIVVVVGIVANHNIQKALANYNANPTPDNKKNYKRQRLIKKKLLKQ